MENSIEVQNQILLTVILGLVFIKIVYKQLKKYETK